jgi:hypothetical protein
VALGEVGLVSVSYRLAACRLPVLLLPVVLALVPLELVVGAAVVAVVGRGGRIVNAELAVFEASPAVAAVAVAAAVVLLFAYAVVLSASVVMAAGVLLGRPVRPHAALAMAVRRVPTLVVLVVLVGVVGVAAAVAGVVMAMWLHTIWAGIVGMAAVVLVAARFAPALPIVLLQGVGLWRGIGRAYTSTWGRGRMTSVGVTAGALVIPVVVVAGLRWALSPVEGIVHTVLVQLLVGVAGMVAVAFQATTLAVAALNQWYPAPARVDRCRPLDLADISARLPTSQGDRVGRRSAALLVAGLVAPGLLYSGYVWANPLDLVATIDHVLEKDFGRHQVALHLLAGRPVALTGPTQDGYSMRVCPDPSCHGKPLYRLGPAGVEAGEMGSVTLPDGSAALAVWAFDESDLDEDREPSRVLRLLTCTAGGCEDVHKAPIVARAGRDFSSYAAAMTTTADGLVVAALAPVDDREPARLRLIRCADVRCASPRTLTTTSLGDRSVGLLSRPLAVAAGSGGRPVAAYEDRATGVVTVISCDDAACRRPKVTEIGGRVLARSVEDDPYLDGVEIVVTPDDRPVIAYRDARTGAARLLRCRTPDCAKANTVTITGPGFWRPWPALALGPDGRPLVATYDLARSRVVLIACHDAGCQRRTSVPLAPLAKGPGHLDLLVGSDGRPRVLWADYARSDFGSGPLHLTMCERIRCGG